MFAQYFYDLFGASALRVQPYKHQPRTVPPAYDYQAHALNIFKHRRIPRRGLPSLITGFAIATDPCLPIHCRSLFFSSFTSVKSAAFPTSFDNFPFHILIHFPQGVILVILGADFLMCDIDGNCDGLPRRILPGAANGVSGGFLLEVGVRDLPSMPSAKLL